MCDHVLGGNSTGGEKEKEKTCTNPITKGYEGVSSCNTIVGGIW